eukprot:TRINITY_DN575_c0_g1_i1.p1 TRINITY_DN575_c0_g1~~TRINITY_DN575_c0_g1_i1.p1  ORF type:complete len:472 (+),score=171.50 TRINITY_DN575_c0_g1_i1:105-1418(+)
MVRHNDPAMPPPPSDAGSGALAHSARMAFTAASEMALRKEWNRCYTTNEDFGRCPDHKRLVVIGQTGAGKSMLLNKLAGFRYKYGPEDQGFRWTRNGVPVDEKDLLFETASGTDSVTALTCYANIHYLGYAPERPLIVVDTPGSDDTSSPQSVEILTEQATDLNVKLQKMGYVNAILVLHKDYQSNRMDPGTFELLKKVSTLFQKAGKDVWSHVVIGYTKVDQKLAWDQGLDRRISDLQESIIQKTKDFPAPCTIKLPVLTFSCYDVELESDPVQCGERPYPKEHPEGGRIAQCKSFLKLYDLLEQLPALESRELAVYEGVEEKLRRAVQERDYHARLSSARKHSKTVIMYLLLFALFILLRPSFLDMSGATDELLFIAGLIYMVGPIIFADSLMVTWDDTIVPWLQTTRLRDHVPLDRLKVLGAPPQAPRLISQKR